MLPGHVLLFASDATLAGLAAGALLVVAVIAHLGERRRQRRAHLDAVGCMPWTTLSVITFFAAVLLLALAGKAWLTG